MNQKNGTNVGIIGLGRMGSCLARGLARSKQFKGKLYFTTLNLQSAKSIEQELKLVRCANNQELVDKCDTVVIAVKPQNLVKVLEEIEKVPSNCLFVSIAASISTEKIEAALNKTMPVIRAMPNTPALVGQSITALSAGKFATSTDLAVAKTLFSPLGRVVEVQERQMDAVTGLSGCGPAYTYLFLESLTEGGIKVGLPRDLATELAAQTVLGAAKMLLETGKHPAALKDEVTTPAGCTIDGLIQLEEGGLRVSLIKAVVQATKRAEKLSK